MLKIIGFVTGTLLTAVVMLVFASHVDGTGAQGELRELLERSSPGPDTRETDSALLAGDEDPDVSTYAPKAVPESIADTAIDRLLPRQPDPIEAATETGEMEPPVDVLETELADAGVVAESDEPPQTDSTPGEAEAAPGDDDEVGAWHAFWTPFRSEASASGFASRLGRDTEREYRVIRTGPGEYRVAFFHTDENDRRARLVEIEQVSGLVLNGGEL